MTEQQETNVMVMLKLIAIGTIANTVLIVSAIFGWI